MPENKSLSLTTSSNKKKNDKTLVTEKRRNTRSTKSVPSSLCETQIENALSTNFELSTVADEFGSTCKNDGKVNVSNSVKILKSFYKDEILAMPNINPKVVLTPLYHSKKNPKETCKLNDKKQKERNHKFWENKLTGACRISKRLKNMKLKNKDFDKKGTKKIKKRHPKISSTKTLARRLKVNVKRHMAPINFSESTETLDVLSNDSTNMEIEKNLTGVDEDDPTITVHGSNQLTHNENVLQSMSISDDIIISQYPEDKVISQESINDIASSHEHEDSQSISATNVKFDSADDLQCEICFESSVDVLKSEESQLQVHLPSDISIISSPEKECDETAVENAESVKVQTNESSPSIEI